MRELLPSAKPLGAQMLRRQFTDEPMVAILAEAAKKHGVSGNTIYVWRKRFGTMTPDETACP